MRDVKAVRDFLESTTIQFDDIIQLMDKDGKAIHEAFVEIKYYSKRASKAYKDGQLLPTLVFVFYSGHGRVENGQTLICDIEGQKDYNIDAFFCDLKLRAHNVGIGVMDCCKEQATITKGKSEAVNVPGKQPGQYHITWAGEVG